MGCGAVALRCMKCLDRKLFDYVILVMMMVVASLRSIGNLAETVGVLAAIAPVKETWVTALLYTEFVEKAIVVLVVRSPRRVCSKPPVRKRSKSS